MATLGENTVPTPVILQNVSEAIGMSEAVFQAELRYQTAVSILKNLRDNGLLTEEEYAVMDTKLRADLELVLGTLLFENDLIK